MKKVPLLPAFIRLIALKVMTILPHSLSKDPLILLKQPELPDCNTMLHQGLCVDPGYSMD